MLMGNSSLTMGFYWSYVHALTLVACSYALLVHTTLDELVYTFEIVYTPFLST